MRNAREQIAAYYEERSTVSAAAEAVLNSGWDYKDPTGTLARNPDEVVDILYAASVEIMMLSDMTQQHRALMRFIFNAYCHAYEAERERTTEVTFASNRRR